MNYKTFNKIYIGSSNIAELIFRGANKIQTFGFEEDGFYTAYFCTGKDVEIGAHYRLVSTFEYWLKIYDDTKLAFNSNEYNTYDIYRAGSSGIIIHAYNITD